MGAPSHEGAPSRLSTHSIEQFGDGSQDDLRMIDVKVRSGGKPGGALAAASSNEWIGLERMERVRAPYTSYVNVEVTVTDSLLAFGMYGS